MNTPKQLTNRTVQITGALLVADAVVFSMVNPRHAAAPWLIIGFLLFGATLFAASSLTAHCFRTYGDTAHTVIRRLLFYLAAVVVVMIGLQSIGQLTVKDVATLAPFALIAYAYMSYGKRNRRLQNLNN